MENYSIGFGLSKPEYPEDSHLLFSSRHATAYGIELAECDQRVLRVQGH